MASPNAAPADTSKIANSAKLEDPRTTASRSPFPDRCTDEPAVIHCKTHCDRLNKIWKTETEPSVSAKAKTPRFPSRPTEIERTSQSSLQLITMSPQTCDHITSSEPHSQIRTAGCCCFFRLVAKTRGILPTRRATKSPGGAERATLFPSSLCGSPSRASPLNIHISSTWSKTRIVPKAGSEMTRLIPFEAIFKRELLPEVSRATSPPLVDQQAPETSQPRAVGSSQSGKPAYDVASPDRVATSPQLNSEELMQVEEQQSPPSKSCSAVLKSGSQRPFPVGAI